MSVRALGLILPCLIVLTWNVQAAVMHSHSVNVHKEREVDGAYSPRDHSHYSESGEHHSEFDHEAIIGKSSARECQSDVEFFFRKR